MAASDALSARQFAPQHPTKTYGSGTSFRLTNQAVQQHKGLARDALAASRSARLAGDPNRAEGMRREAAVHRDQAMAGATAHYAPYKSTWRYGDIKKTRKLP